MMSRVCKIGRVRAAGVGDEDGAEVAEGLVEQSVFFGQGHLRLMVAHDYIRCISPRLTDLR